MRFINEVSIAPFESAYILFVIIEHSTVGSFVVYNPHLKNNVTITATYQI